jgi:hypothetical protein
MDGWWGNGSQTKPINPVLASIAVAVQRIYSTVDNPYTPIVTFLMLTWTLHKISMFERSMVLFHTSGKNITCSGEDPQSGNNSQPSKTSVVVFQWARAVDILFDCFLLSMLLYTGVIIQASGGFQRLHVL